MDDPVELPESIARRAERLLVDHTGTTGQPGLAKGLRQPAKGDGRNGQVMRELRSPPSEPRALPITSSRLPGLSALNPRRRRTTAPRRRPAPRFRLGAGFGNRIAHAGTEVLVRNVAAAVADQQPLLRQQALLGEPVESRQDEALGQVAGRPEQDEDRRPQLRMALHCGWHACQPT